MSDIPSEMRQEYSRYIASPQWKQKRAAALERAQHRCQRCGFSKWSKPLEVHHLTYERLGNERSGDLIVLCKECHEKADEERADRGRRKSQESLEAAQLSGWATKVFGANWSAREDIDHVRERFEEWKERSGS